MRIGLWLCGALAGLGLAFALPPTAGLPAFLVGLLSVGLAGELVLSQRGARTRATAGRPPPRDDRPADGVVEVVPVAGANGPAHPRDPRFRRFQAIDPDAADRIAPGLLAPPPLLGRVALVSLFLGRYGQGWSEAEIARAHVALTKAGEWIERQAIRWQAPLNIALADTYFAAADDRADDVEVAFVPEGDTEAPFEAGATVKAVAAFSRASARLGFADAADLTARVGRRIDADAIVWLMHLRCAGRSHVVLHDDDTLPGVALAVCYAREANFPEPLPGPPYVDPVTIVHELMHLFGASDKYGVPLHSFPARSVTERDIMCLDFESLSRLRIDALTAHEIGWPTPHPTQP